MQGKDTERVKFGDKDYSCTCYQCGGTFESTRSDASFCSARCRVAHSREPVKRQNALTDIEQMMTRIIELSRKYKHDNEIQEAIEKLARVAMVSAAAIEG
jgi:hypothetical protein